MSYIIILAGGTGSRCKYHIPKQFAMIGDRPILVHTIQKFSTAFPDMQPVLVIHPSYQQRLRDMMKTYELPYTMKVVIGGEHRFHSVQCALDSIQCEGDDIIGVHDAVRPFVSAETITEAFEAAAITGASVPVISVTNTIRCLEGNENRAVDRQSLRVVQTPQVFKAGILKKAYKQTYQPHFYDCATVVEQAGFAVQLTAGNYENIKITHPQDLYLAQAIYKNIHNGSLPDQGESRPDIYHHL